MGANLPRKKDIQNKLSAENNQMPGLVDPFFNANENQEVSQMSDSQNSDMLRKINSYLPEEEIPNEVLFYQHVNWLSSLNHNDHSVEFPFSDQQLVTENYTPNDINLNEDLFYQNVNWMDT